MKSSLHDRAKGMGREIKGKMKEGLGRANNDPNMADEGVADQISGHAQRKVGQVKKVFGR
jgi:uncharacterized protein YjbJ (UPF0337 family)